MSRKIILGSDHVGLPLKEVLRDYLVEKGYDVVDIGTYTPEPIDYPDIAEMVAIEVIAKHYERGILICGTGAGMAIAANKIPNVRAVAVYDPYTAERARASNNAQIITLGSQTCAPEVAKILIDIWLRTEFQGGRSVQKVAKIGRLDEKYRKARE
jgi:ribose 5-phosphate isomerase B